MQKILYSWIDRFGVLKFKLIYSLIYAVILTFIAKYILRYVDGIERNFIDMNIHFIIFILIGFMVANGIVSNKIN